MRRLTGIVFTRGNAFISRYFSLLSGSVVAKYWVGVMMYLAHRQRKEWAKDFTKIIGHNTDIKCCPAQAFRRSYELQALDMIFQGADYFECEKAKRRITITPSSKHNLAVNPISNLEVFAAFHFSNYSSLASGLSAVVGPDRPCRVLVNDIRLYQRIEPIIIASRQTFPNIEYTLIDNRKAFTNLIREMKNAGGVLVCYADLPGKFGLTDGFMFLGRESRLTVGHLRLAKILNAPLRSFFVEGTVNEKGATVHISKHYCSDGALQVPVKSMGQEVLDDMTFALHNFPHEWRLWHQLELFFHPSDTAPLN